MSTPSTHVHFSDVNGDEYIIPKEFLWVGVDYGLAGMDPTYSLTYFDEQIEVSEDTYQNIKRILRPDIA